MQPVIVAFIVLASAAYATWSLMPAAARAWLQRVVLRREVVAASGCGGCGGCASSAPKVASSSGAAQPIRIVRR